MYYDQYLTHQAQKTGRGKKGEQVQPDMGDRVFEIKGYAFGVAGVGVVGGAGGTGGLGVELRGCS